VALFFFAAAVLVMFLDRRATVPDLARVLTAAGLGSLAFGLLRFMLKTFFRDELVWADFWEELTELIFILSIAVMLLLFLQRLFGEALPKGQEIKAGDILSLPPPLRPSLPPE
jgi:uncharacterized membrane protein